MSPKDSRPVGAPAGRGGQFASKRNPEAETDLEDPDVPFPADLRQYLPEQTTYAWIKLSPSMPPSAYLAGGTALTIHLRHRVSRDLDFMLERREDIGALRARIESTGTLAVTHQDESTLNGVFEDTKVQVLEASGQRMVAPTTTVAGLRVASTYDIMAMKLKVIVDRGELRDYFDLMEIDRCRLVSAEEGLALFVERYSPANPDEYVSAIVRSLGYLGDVADDPALPAGRDQIESYWAARLPALLRNISRW